MVYCTDCQNSNDLLVNMTKKGRCDICGKNTDCHHVGNRFLEREGFSVNPDDYTPKHPIEKFFE